jgi:hypothetical protein
VYLLEMFFTEFLVIFYASNTEFLKSFDFDFSVRESFTNDSVNDSNILEEKDFIDCQKDHNLDNNKKVNARHSHQGRMESKEHDVKSNKDVTIRNSLRADMSKTQDNTLVDSSRLFNESK